MNLLSAAKREWARWRRVSAVVKDLFRQHRPAERPDRPAGSAADVLRAAGDDFMPLPW